MVLPDAVIDDFRVTAALDLVVASFLAGRYPRYSRMLVNGAVNMLAIVAADAGGRGYPDSSPHA